MSVCVCVKKRVGEAIKLPSPAQTFLSVIEITCEEYRQEQELQELPQEHFRKK